MTAFIPAFREVCREHGHRVALADYTPRRPPQGGTFDYTPRRPPQGGTFEDPQETFTYSELLECVVSAGTALGSRGLGPESLVALKFPKSASYVIAVLACWWCGAAFLPLDPDLPEERQQRYLMDAQPDLVLERLPERPPSRGAAGGISEAGEPVEVGPEDLAYVIYTSGSSGRPKGVEICHAGLVPLLLAQIEAFGLGPGKRALWLLSMQFDASLSDLGTALLSGATLIVADRGAALDLPRRLSEARATHLDVPPALLRSYRPEEMPECLETLVVGGEPSEPALLRQWARRFRVINVYGPTEATICTSLCRVDESWQAPRLGLPVAGMRHLVVDGELCIAGPGLTRGYRGQPELTREKLVEWQGQRVYRSGDRVELLPDGDCLFLGRLDRQIKLRGQRIELEEIEACALAFPGVVRCAVVAQSDALVAFFSGAAAACDLRRYLGERLPAFMVPQRLVPLEAMPLTDSGKNDLPGLARIPLEGDGRGCPPGMAEGCSSALDSLSTLALRGATVGLATDELRHRALRLAVSPGVGGPGRSILLTGATGALGSCMLTRLLQGQHRVIKPELIILQGS